MKKIGLFLLVMATIGGANASFNGLSIHSRANCINNESISWDWTHDWWLWTASYHYLLDENTNEMIDSHIINTGKWQNTWRSAAVHWGEGVEGKWKVIGMHYILSENNQIKLLGQEEVNNCSIYDGWWDKDKIV